MKRFFFLLSLISPFFGIQAQTPAHDQEGDPIRYEQETEVHSITPDLERNLLQVSPAGDQIEGDYMGEIRFTKDGSRALVLNRTTNNMTVFQFETQEILANVPVGTQPVALDVTEAYAIIACLGSNEAYIIDLTDYSLAAAIPTAGQPSVVRTSPDGKRAFVGCDETDACEVIDLETLEKEYTIADFPVYLFKFSFITSGPRNAVFWSGFEVAPDNSYLVNGAGDDQGLFFYDTETGDPVDTLTEVLSSPQLAFSGDGSKLIAVDYGSPAKVYQIDAVTREVLHTYILSTDVSAFSTYSIHAVNTTGDKVYLPLSGNQSTIINLPDSTSTIISGIGSANWVGVSPDRQYAIHGGYYLSLVDFNSETIVNTNQGRPIAWGAVSPTQPYILAADQLRYEGVYFYDYEQDVVAYEGTKLPGSLLEGDNPYSVAFVPNSDFAITVNQLSRSASLINYGTANLESIIPLGDSEVYHVAVTPDGQYALIPLRLLNQVAVIDLSAKEVVATVPSGGNKPANIKFHPFLPIAYVVNAGSPDVIGMIEVAGADSELTNTFSAGNMGISWTNYGIRSGFEIHPDGGWAMVAASFDDQVHVIEAESGTIDETFDVPGFPLQIAFSDDGTFALVTLKNTNEVALFGFGSSAELIDIVEGPQNPTRVAWDSDQNRFAVCGNDDKAISYFDPFEAQFTGSQTFGDDLTPISVLYNDQGYEFALLRSANDELTPHQIRIEEDMIYDLPALPIHHFALSENGLLAAICHPGTDELSLTEIFIDGLREIRTSPRLEATSYPTPAKSSVTIELINAEQNERVTSAILYSNDGKQLRTLSGFNTQQIQLERGGLSSGTYICNLYNGRELIASATLIFQ
jgi:DNA-binding beta-propeller fold protein YncE